MKGAGSPRRTTGNYPMFPAECQAEVHSHVTDTPARECGYESETEKLSRRVSIKADTSSKTSQKDKTVTLMEWETDMNVSMDEATRETSAQQITDMLKQNNHGHVKHSRGIARKPMVQKPLKQTFDNIKTRSHPLHTTTESDLTYEERRVTCTHQCKKCSNQHLT